MTPRSDETLPIFLAEILVEPRPVPWGAVVRPLRPLPVWCPLPRGGSDPKITVVGWLAGHQRSIDDLLLVTASWGLIKHNTPETFSSDGQRAIDPVEAVSSEGILWSIAGRSPSLESLSREFFSSLHQLEALDICAINEARSAVTDDLPSGSIAPLPARGRAVLGVTSVTDTGVEQDEALRSTAVEVGALPYTLTTLSGTMPSEKLMEAITLLSRLTVRDWLIVNADEIEKLKRGNGGSLDPAISAAEAFSGNLDQSILANPES